MWDLITDKSIRVLVVSSIVLQMAQQLCGINAVFYYSTTFFTGIIDDPLQGTTLVAFVNVVATYVALKLMDNKGRRALVLWSAGGMIVSTVFIIAALLGYVPKFIALFAVMTFVSFFEIGLGPIPWLIVAEMFDAKYVATAMSVASQVNWGCNFFVGIGFPFMNQYLGPWSFGPFGLVLVLAFFFTYAYLPETQGRTVEEVQRLVAGDDDEVKQAIHVIQAVESYDMH
jgi:SP family facilitated glucose transporter-like MFS transporter 3